LPQHSLFCSGLVAAQRSDPLERQIHMLEHIINMGADKSVKALTRKGVRPFDLSRRERCVPSVSPRLEPAGDGGSVGSRLPVRELPQDTEDGLLGSLRVGVAGRSFGGSRQCPGHGAFSSVRAVT
jgi:hypothetical protein